MTFNENQPQRRAEFISRSRIHHLECGNNESRVFGLSSQNLSLRRLICRPIVSEVKPVPGSVTAGRNTSAAKSKSSFPCNCGPYDFTRHRLGIKDIHLRTHWFVNCHAKYNNVSCYYSFTIIGTRVRCGDNCTGNKQKTLHDFVSDYHSAQKGTYSDCLGLGICKRSATFLLLWPSRSSRERKKMRAPSCLTYTTVNRK